MIPVANKVCDTASEGYYGSGMLSLSAGRDKLGPYDDAEARHEFQQSAFHRDVDFCGSCHDVSNSAVGDLAPGNGAQPGAPHVISSQDFNGGAPNLGGPVEKKAAFNNPPYAYGIIERTFSEYKASAFPTTRVADFLTFPRTCKQPGDLWTSLTRRHWLRATAVIMPMVIRDISAARVATCALQQAPGATRRRTGAQDMPKHDHTGGNYWLADIIKYQDSQGPPAPGR